jgi:hypothetical protein
VPSGTEDASVRQALKLIRDGLRLHRNRSRKIGYSQLAGPRQSVQQAETGIVGQDLEDAHQPRSLVRR